MIEVTKWLVSRIALHQGTWTTNINANIVVVRITDTARYDENSERNTDGKYLSQEFKEMQHGEKCSRCSKADRYSTVFDKYPSRYSSYEYKDFGRGSSLYY